MSRCFPFQQQGYERKHKTEDLDLLKEAKPREKKHKKEKKDKDRKKDKKKEKDEGDERRKEKKERKSKHKDKNDKHRDKKKDKEDRGKEKETSSISEESTVAGTVEEESGGKIHHPQEYIRNGSSALFQGGKPLQNNLPSKTIEDSKFVQELGRRIKNDDSASQLPEKLALVEKGYQEEMTGRAAAGNSLLEDDTKIKRIDRKMDPKGLTHENTLVQHITPTSRSNVDKMSRARDEQTSWMLEDKEKYKEAANINHQKDRGKGSHVKKKEKEKEKQQQQGEVRLKSEYNKKSEQGEVRLKSECNKKSKQGKLNDGGKTNLGGNVSIASTDVLKNSNSSADNEENIRKRKDMDTNGFLHEHDRPNKMQKPAPRELENGRKLQGLQTPTNLPLANHLIHNSIQTDKKNQLVNGIIEGERPSPPKQNSSAATLVGYHSAEAPKFPPLESNHLSKTDKVPEIEDLIAALSRQPAHPDSKYLAEVLTVPKIRGWSKIDDQDWLFGNKCPSSKSKVESAGVREDPPVWSEAVHIESIDLCALPYVIPY